MSVKLMTLCIVCKDKKVLLGMKKRGFGVGRWNGFGGKVQEDETIEESLRREMEEECGLKLGDLEELGVLEFEFAKKPGDILEVHIFKSIDFSGEPTESEEMKPEWFDEDKVPFEKMWSDDPYWFPLFLAGKKFKGHFLFDDNDQILEKNIEVIK
ncbi:MAG: 8-oxo-dGTP diphosphatase [Patescibacteria group bacterium]|nr:8-oxo-dGTP diphosphatase [Patescibacteria group bacterium]